MSPRRKQEEPRGSGPGGRIEVADIRAKLEELKGEVDSGTDAVKPYLLYAAIGGAVVVVTLAFLVGRSRGRRKSTWVEIRRR